MKDFESVWKLWKYMICVLKTKYVESPNNVWNNIEIVDIVWNTMILEAAFSTSIHGPWHGPQTSRSSQRMLRCPPATGTSMRGIPPRANRRTRRQKSQILEWWKRRTHKYVVLRGISMCSYKCIQSCFLRINITFGQWGERCRKDGRFKTATILHESVSKNSFQTLSMYFITLYIHFHYILLLFQLLSYIIMYFNLYHTISNIVNVFQISRIPFVWENPFNIMCFQFNFKWNFNALQGPCNVWKIKSP